MGTMNTYGYHYDMASETGNKYSLIIDGKEVISGGTFSSILENFKHEVNCHRGSCIEAYIAVKKTYDGKKRECTNEIVREFDNRRKF